MAQIGKSVRRRLRADGKLRLDPKISEAPQTTGDSIGVTRALSNHALGAESLQFDVPGRADSTLICQTTWLGGAGMPAAGGRIQ